MMHETKMSAVRWEVIFVICTELLIPLPMAYSTVLIISIFNIMQNGRLSLGVRHICANMALKIVHTNLYPAYITICFHELDNVLDYKERIFNLLVNTILFNKY